VISPALIELKMNMGVTNMTKDVANSWFINIIIEKNKELFVRTRKKEQHINNLFQFEWSLILHYDQNVRCKGTLFFTFPQPNFKVDLQGSIWRSQTLSFQRLCIQLNSNAKKK
jgi:hypothetical protein